MKFIKGLIPYVIITLVVVLIRIFIISPARVDGTSMYPTLDNREYILIKKYDKSYERFDIVVLRYEKEDLIKRIIGLPGDYVEYLNNELYINGKKVEEKFLSDETTTWDFNIDLIGYDKIPDNYYFVVGDNRTNSKDSRLIGLIPKKDIKGIALFSLSKFKKVN